MLQPVLQRRKESGFTLLELLIAITIIGLLASVVLASLGDSRHKANVSQAISQIREIEKALILWANIENIQSWKITGTCFPSCYTNHAIPNLIENGNSLGFDNFSAYLPKPPIPPYGDYWGYFNDDIPYSCDEDGDSYHSGVSIRLHAPNAENLDELFTDMDEIIDGGDGPDCGRVRQGGSSETIYYRIANYSDDI